MLVNLGKFLLSLGILFVMLYLGKLLNWLLPIGISDSIWGMLLLFLGLLSGVIKVPWIAPSARLLTRYMAIFFLPVCVGMMEHTDLLLEHIDSFFLTTFVSTLVSLVSIGLIAQWIFNKKGNTNE